MNSCYADAKIWCEPKYSRVPQILHRSAMRPACDAPDTKFLACMDELADLVDDSTLGRIAGFAHYSGNGGVAVQDSTYSTS